MYRHKESTGCAVKTAISAQWALLPGGWASDVRVEIDAEGRISGVATGAALGVGDQRIPFLLPAVSNLHSHTFQRAMAGLAERRGPSGRDSFWTWRAVMYRFLDILTPDEIEAIAAFAFMEMLEAGFSAVAEFHYLHHQPGGAGYDDPGELSARVAAASATAGIGLTLLPVYYRHGGVDGRPLAGGQLRFGCDRDRFERLLAGASAAVKGLPADAAMGIAPHSLRAVGVDDLAWASALMPGRPVHMHLAEQEQEVDETLAVHGARPVRLLLDRAAVDRRWCLIHCTQMQPGETARLAATGATAGLCPVTEANLGDGIFDGERFAEAGGAFGIGSDSNIRISVAGELRQLEYSQRLRDRARVVVAGPGQSAGRVLYDGARAGGARALGRDTGAIAEGRFADLVAIDPPAIPSSDPDTLLDAWLFCGSDAEVREVWAAGRHVVSGGRHRDRGAIDGRYRATLAAIGDRL
ncbi:MAG: formimidoylglutamate deiminase [Rhizobiaceae bacterium]|nr:formimidoylglutamate deiminase [Rhizobiaceae bacterium]